MHNSLHSYLYQLTARPHGSKEWARLDFSINTNPLGPPESVKAFFQQGKDLSWLTKYPDINTTGLKASLAKKLGVKSDEIIIGNGAAEIFFLLPRVLKIKRGIIIHPTFGEYEPALTAANIPILRLYYDLKNDSFDLPFTELINILEQGDLVYLCRPNNPTGQMVDKNIMKKFLSVIEEKKGYLLVDESFIDFTEEPEGLIALFNTNRSLLLVRSLTKFYTIPGIRLGYMVAPNWLVDRLELARDPWSVNGLAQQIGLRMLEDELFYNKTRAWLIEEKEWFFQQMQLLSEFKIYPSSTNFHLVQAIKYDARQLYNFLKEKQIAIRLAGSFPGLNGQYFRLAIRKREENMLLLRELKAFVQSR